MRSARVITVVICTFCLLAVPASAKDGVRAKLEGSARLGTAPGKTIRLSGASSTRAGIVRRIGDLPAGLTLRRRVAPREGSQSGRRAGGSRRGRSCPAGGIRMLRVGLVGWRTAGGVTERADMVFGFRPAVRAPLRRGEDVEPRAAVDPGGRRRGRCPAQIAGVDQRLPMSLGVFGWVCFSSGSCAS